MPNIRLINIEGRGRAEVSRWILAVAQIEYEDVRLKPEEWQKLKPSFH